MKRWIALLVVITMVSLSVPTFAQGNLALHLQPPSQETVKKITIGALVAGVVVGSIYLFNSIKKNNQAKKLYELARDYEAQGQWPLAADTYAECIQIRPGYQDVQERWQHAREEAALMLLGLGKKAQEGDRFQEADEYLRQAMVYNPTSTQVVSAMEKLSQELVAIYYRRGLTYSIQNRWQEAYLQFEKAYYQNPDYKDLRVYYLRAKAIVEGDMALRGIAFFVNHTEEAGLERVLLQALQKELEEAHGEFYLLDLELIQSVVKEQAVALSDTLNSTLAVDIGRIVGADEMLIGDLLSLEEKGDRVLLDVEVQLVRVSSGEIIDSVSLTHKFKKGVGLADLSQYMGEVAARIVKKID